MALRRLQAAGKRLAMLSSGHVRNPYVATGASEQVCKLQVSKYGARQFSSSAGSSEATKAVKTNKNLFIGIGAAAGAGLLYKYMSSKDVEVGVVPSLEKVGQDSGVITSSGKHPKQLPAFQLTDHTGRTWTDEDLLGDFAVILFGSTVAPGFQPHLHKLSDVLNLMERKSTMSAEPLFISLNPEKDTPQQVTLAMSTLGKNPSPPVERLSWRGLIGPDGVKVWEAAKKHLPGKTNKNSQEDTEGSDTWDGVVYLVDPDGKFVARYAKELSAEDISNEIAGEIRYYKQSNPGWKGPKAVKARTA